MHFMWFTERAYHYDPDLDPEKYRAYENEVIRKRSFFATPNSMFEPEVAARLLNQYLDEKIYTDAELLNFDGVMLNEHHGNPFCLGAVMDVEAAALDHHGGDEDRAEDDEAQREGAHRPERCHE